MSTEIQGPKERDCVRCGRTEQWDAESEHWAVGEDSVGNVHCIHAWDITGKFSPVDQ